MKVRVSTTSSFAPRQSIALVAALADFVAFRSMKRGKEAARTELLDLARLIWPKLEVHEGSSHFRIFLDGRSKTTDGESVYLEWA